VKRIWITLGVFGPLLLGGCALMVLLTGICGWLLLKPEQKSQLIHIVPLAPLTTPPATTGSGVVGGETTPSAPATPVAPEVAATSVAVEKALGFALPPGSVNSVAQAGVATRVVIPRLKLDALVMLAPIKGDSWQVDHLGQAVGHLEGTAAPGSNSNIVLAGHVTLSASVYGPFAGLGQLAAGDLITVYEGDIAYNYLVDGYQTVDRTAVQVTYPTNTGQITLITCNNWSNTEGRYIERLIVKGHLVKN
jgi:LPXTG-site transpeptidase (sortase) family protein